MSLAQTWFLNPTRVYRPVFVSVERRVVVVLRLTGSFFHANAPHTNRTEWYEWTVVGHVAQQLLARMP